MLHEVLAAASGQARMASRSTLRAQTRDRLPARIADLTAPSTHGAFVVGGAQQSHWAATSASIDATIALSPTALPHRRTTEPVAIPPLSRARHVARQPRSLMGNPIPTGATITECLGGVKATFTPTPTKRCTAGTPTARQSGAANRYGEPDRAAEASLPRLCVVSAAPSIRCTHPCQSCRTTRVDSVRSSV